MKRLLFVVAAGIAAMVVGCPACLAAIVDRPRK